MFEYPIDMKLMLESMLKMCSTSTLEHMHHQFTVDYNNACIAYAEQVVLKPLKSSKHVLSDEGRMALQRDIEYTSAGLSALNDALNFAKANDNWALADGDELPYTPKKVGKISL